MDNTAKGMHTDSTEKKMPYIQVRNASVSFHGVNGNLCALKEVSLDVNENEFLVLIGPSGCGKSTLLNLIGQLASPTSGEVIFPRSDGTALHRVSYVFQEAVMLPWRNLLENVCLPLEVLGKNSDGDHDRARELIELVGLKGFETASPRTLSGGMKQRACIARALVSDPSLILMDEPFAALDEISRMEMNDQLQGIWIKTKKTIILVTHSIQEAAFLADRVAIMSARPGQLKSILDIELERPRTLETITSKEFTEYTTALRRALYS